MEKRFRELAHKEGVVSGYACLWGRPSYIDSVGHESFMKDSLKLSRHGVCLHSQHNESEVLASSKSGTLKIKPDDKGLFFEASIPKNALLTRELLQRKDLSGASAGFIVQDQVYESDGTRNIKSAELHEISLVSKPAHSGTEVSFRKAQKPRRDWTELL